MGHQPKSVHKFQKGTRIKQHVNRLTFITLVVFAAVMTACNSSTDDAAITVTQTAVSPPTRPPKPTLPPRTETAVTPLPEPTTAPPTAVSAPDRSDAVPQFGLNFIRFFWSEEGATDMSIINTDISYAQPDWIFEDFDELGVEAFRQFIKADLLWDIVEPQDDQWHFDEADAVIIHAPIQPIVTLFKLQYASPTPPWSDEFQKTMGVEATDYLTTVVQRYAPYVTYWEIGNEMDHWRAFDPNDDGDADSAHHANTAVPPGGFSPEEQGAFLAEAAAIIRANDPDAVILMPGMGGIDAYTLDTWFAGVLAGGGSDWFDIVNYHFYPNWVMLTPRHRDLDRFMAAQGIDDKPIWLTETGSTADPSLTDRTDYPNSPETQAADVFRRAILAYALGDDFVMWHTYIGSPAVPNNTWRLYGVRTDTAVMQPSYAAVQLLTTELLPYQSVEPVSGQIVRGWHVYKVETAASQTKYVAWGEGDFRVPDGITQMTTVVPNADGGYEWTAVSAGETIPLTDVPLLFK